MKSFITSGPGMTSETSSYGPDQARQKVELLVQIISRLAPEDVTSRHVNWVIVYVFVVD